MAPVNESPPDGETLELVMSMSSFREVETLELVSYDDAELQGDYWLSPNNGSHFVSCYLWRGAMTVIHLKRQEGLSTVTLK